MKGKTIQLNPYQKMEILEAHSNGFEFRLLERGSVLDYQVLHTSLGQKITVPDIDEFLKEINTVKEYLEFLKFQQEKQEKEKKDI